MFSKACEYGIRATIFIASKSLDGERVSLKEIAREIDSPVAFTAKILQLLAREGVVKSVKGPSGGFEIDRGEIESVRLIEVVSAIDGDQVFKGCGLGLPECDENHPCPVHDRFMAIRDELYAMLSNTSISELALGLGEGLTYLKR